MVGENNEVMWENKHFSNHKFDIKQLHNTNPLKYCTMNYFTKRNKNLEKLRGIYFQIGLIVAGGLTLLAFEWTTPINTHDLPDCTLLYDEEWELPPILPEKEIEKPKVKFTEARQKSETFIIVKELPEPTPETLPEPTPDPELKFNPDEYYVPEKIEDEKIHTFVGEMPEFIGGVKELFKYLGSNLKYPVREKETGIQGTVHLQFVIGKKGEIKNIEVLRGVNEAIDNEAIRVLKAMPNWKPGKQYGKTVNVKYNLPIKFKLR